MDRDTRISLLLSMLRIRMVEEKIVELYPEQEMRCPTHLYIGQEAVSAGVCQNLKKRDYLFSSYRSHGAYIAKGGSIKELFAELYGKKTGCSKGKGGSMHIISKEVNFMGTSALVGGVIPIAAGTALASSMKREKRVSVVFFGDGACEEGVFQETLNFAALKKLPVVFMCENNFYATNSHQLTRQAVDNIYKRSEIYNIPGFRIDGNNVLEVFKVSKRAVENARNNRGPSLIECRTYRWLEHVGPYFDYDLGYRSKAELDKWIKKCPLTTYESVLLKKGVIRRSALDKMKEKLRREIEDAVSFAKKSPFPSVKDTHKDVYEKKR
ncbi:MAG: thiamine pyrophosphate-dependent dehydrogenase E1 component subunit alpha [Candidatus Omnitrophica bacterium]|nr:thiamine pyrophosphate-dependent dehydrogenase E1 component subunit alpha [Candidatus Omnitrophota bacterium]